MDRYLFSQRVERFHHLEDGLLDILYTNSKMVIEFFELLKQDALALKKEAKESTILNILRCDSNCQEGIVIAIIALIIESND